MNHKRGKPKSGRAGCLMCKPHKRQGAGSLKLKVQKVGFSKIRGELHQIDDLKDA